MNIILLIPPSPQKRKIIRNIDCSMETKGNYLWQPSDFMIITSHLKPDDNVFFIDGTADSLSGEEFFKQLGQIKGGDILFFALSSVCWQSDIQYFRQVKKLFQGMPTFVIGDIFIESLYKNFILQECDGIVFIPHILNLQMMAQIGDIKKETDIPGVCTRQDQNVLGKSKTPIYFQGGFPRHDIFLKRGYRFPFARHRKFSTVTTLWGCPFACSYCTDSKIPPIIRPYDDVINELQYIASIGINELFFADKTFGYPYKNSFPLLEEMAKSFNFQFSCYFHPQTYTPKLFELMKNAGCKTVIIGIDSANLMSLKQYNRKVIKQNIDNLLLKAIQLDINVCADFILGLGHETEADIKNTIKHALMLPIDYASFNIAAPLPGSDIRQRAFETGKLSFGTEGLDTFGSEGILGNENIDYAKLRKMRNNALIKFYFRPIYIIKRLIKTSSLEHLQIQFEEMFGMIKKTFFTRKVL